MPLSVNLSDTSSHGELLKSEGDPLTPQLQSYDGHPSHSEKMQTPHHISMTTGFSRCLTPPSLPFCSLLSALWPPPSEASSHPSFPSPSPLPCCTALHMPLGYTSSPPLGCKPQNLAGFCLCLRIQHHRGALASTFLSGGSLSSHFSLTLGPFLQ